MAPRIHANQLELTRVQFDYQPEAPDTYFPAYTDGSRWNGWACPLFTRAQSEQVVAFLNTAWENPRTAERGPRARYDAARDAFVVYWDDGLVEDADVYEGVDVTTPDGQQLRLYAIGAWGCTWVDERDE